MHCQKHDLPYERCSCKDSESTETKLARRMKIIFNLALHNSWTASEQSKRVWPSAGDDQSKRASRTLDHSPHPVIIQWYNHSCKLSEYSVITIAMFFSTLCTPNIYGVLQSTRKPFAFAVQYRSLCDVNPASVPSLSWIFASSRL